MTDINLVKLKELAQRYSDSFAAHKSDPKNAEKLTAWDCATHEFSEAIGHGAEDIVCMLIERLEAAQRERDEAIQQKNESGERFYKAVQYGAKLESELKRRDAQEPVALQFLSDAGKWEHCHSRDVAERFGFKTFRPLYAATPAAVLPKHITSADAPELAEISAEANRLGIMGAYASFAVGANWMLQKCIDKLNPAAPAAVLPAEPTAEMQAAGAAAIRFDTTLINKLFTANAVYRAMRDVLLKTDCNHG